MDMIFEEKWLLAITLSAFALLNTQQIQAQQPEQYVGFSLEELSAIDVVKPLLPLEVDSAYVVSGNTINIGYLLPMAGYPEFTSELRNAANLAIEEINDHGGVLGKKLTLIPTDIGGIEEFVVERTHRLIDNYNTTLFMGPTSSDALITLFDHLLAEKDFLIVSPTATSPSVTDLDDRGLIFRTCPSDAVQGMQTASFCYEKLNVRKGAILYQNNYYGKALSNVFTEEFSQLGGEILNTISYNPMVNLESYDMTEKLDSLLMGKPDVIYIVGMAAAFSAISYQIEEKGLFTNDYTPVLVMSDGAKAEDLIAQGNPSVIEGMHGFYLAFTGNKAFAEKYEQKYGGVPLSLASEFTYDIIYLLALAMLEAEGTDPKVLSKHLESVSKKGFPVSYDNFLQARELISRGKDINYTGLSGNLDFDEHGDVNERNFSRWQLINGEIKYFDK